MSNYHDRIMQFIDENKVIVVEQKVDQSSEGDKFRKITNYSKQLHVSIVDNRTKGGAFWVYYQNEDDIHARILKEMGMRYKAGRGWWIK